MKTLENPWHTSFPRSGNDVEARFAFTRAHGAKALDSGLRRNDGEGERSTRQAEAIRPRRSRRRAATCVDPSLASVSRYGAVWPSVEQEEPRLFPTASSPKACRVGGFQKAISLGYFSLGQQREVTRAPAGARKPAAGEHPGDSADMSESLPQANLMAIAATRAKARLQANHRGTQATNTQEQTATTGPTTKAPLRIARNTPHPRPQSPRWFWFHSRSRILSRHCGLNGSGDAR
jgi:hypothetical protein